MNYFRMRNMVSFIFWNRFVVQRISIHRQCREEKQRALLFGSVSDRIELSTFIRLGDWNNLSDNHTKLAHVKSSITDIIMIRSGFSLWKIKSECMDHSTIVLTTINTNPNIQETYYISLWEKFWSFCLKSSFYFSYNTLSRWAILEIFSMTQWEIVCRSNKTKEKITGYSKD